ncbi:MAG: transcriptional regulator [Planctomycetaceae bacterium]|nr:transcriptional regulator [Planctomycetaceae bacterium]
MSNRPNPFAKTRRDHADETAEDYVEAIEDIELELGACRVKDLATRMQVSHVTVTRILNRLTDAGLVTRTPYGPVGLSDAGLRMARASRDRHEIVVAFLRGIGVTSPTAERDAEGMEHHVSVETLAAMRRHIEQA